MPSGEATTRPLLYQLTTGLLHHQHWILLICMQGDKARSESKTAVVKFGGLQLQIYPIKSQIFIWMIKTLIVHPICKQLGIYENLTPKKTETSWNIIIKVILGNRPWRSGEHLVSSKTKMRLSRDWRTREPIVEWVRWWLELFFVQIFCRCCPLVQIPLVNRTGPQDGFLFWGKVLIIWESCQHVFLYNFNGSNLQPEP